MVYIHIYSVRILFVSTHEHISNIYRKPRGKSQSVPASAGVCFSRARPIPLSRFIIRAIFEKNDPGKNILYLSILSAQRVPGAHVVSCTQLYTHLLWKIRIDTDRNTHGVRVCLVECDKICTAGNQSKYIQG